MRTRALLLSAAAIASVFLAACGSSGSADSGTSTSTSSPGAGKTIYINQFANGLRAFTRRAEGIEAYAKAHGWKVIGNEYGDNTVETQIKQIQTELVKHPSAIFLIPINPAALTPVIAQAKQQGTDIVTMGSNVSDPSQVVSFVSYTPQLIGQQKAAYIAKQLKGKGTVGVIDGPQGANFADGQITGYKAEFAKYPGITVVDAGHNDWSPQAGLKATQNLLQRTGGKVDAIYFNNDDQAAGGIEAIKNRGIDPKTLVTVGSDASPAVVDLIRAGDMSYTTSSCSYAAGQLAAQQLAAKWAGRTPPKEVPVHQIPITHDTVDDVLGLPIDQCGS